MVDKVFVDQEAMAAAPICDVDSDYFLLPSRGRQDIGVWIADDPTHRKSGALPSLGLATIHRMNQILDHQMIAFGLEVA